MGSYENNIFLILKTIYIKKSQFYSFYYSRLLYKLGKNSFFSNILVTSQQGSLRCTHLGKILQILSFFKKVSVVRRFIVFSNSFNNVLPKTILNRPQKRGVLYMGSFGMRGGLVTSILFIKKSILKFISIVSSTVVHVFCFDCHSPFNSFIDHSPSHTYL